MVLTAMALLSFGMIMVYSASVRVTGGDDWLARRHLLYAAVAMGVILLGWRLDYRWLDRGHHWRRPAVLLLGLSLLLALAVLHPAIGAEINGARRWMRFGTGAHLVSFQPSELVKLAIVAYLAMSLGRPDAEPRSFRRGFLPAAVAVGAALAPVIFEDFGTAVVIALSAGAVMLMAGVRLSHMFLLAPPAAGAFYALVVRDPMRWARITSFLDPAQRSYQSDQALIAIGSGSFWGKGLGNGAMKLGYLPEDSTDFIFAIVGEEMGFVGAALLLGLVAMLLVLCWKAAARADTSRGRLLAGGLGFLVVVQALLHVAVNIGCAPPTGVSLPLVSAGGTALVLMGAAVSMVLSVSTFRGSHEPEASFAAAVVGTDKRADVRRPVGRRGKARTASVDEGPEDEEMLLEESESLWQQPCAEQSECGEVDDEDPMLDEDAPYHTEQVLEGAVRSVTAAEAEEPEEEDGPDLAVAEGEPAAKGRWLPWDDAEVIPAADAEDGAAEDGDETDEEEEEWEYVDEEAETDEEWEYIDVEDDEEGEHDQDDLEEQGDGESDETEAQDDTPSAENAGVASAPPASVVPGEMPDADEVEEVAR